MKSRIEVHCFHPVDFIEDLKVDEQKEVLCGVCEDAASGPSFKCSMCDFHCHESCANIPTRLEHPLHQEHTLFVRYPSRLAYCDACGKSWRRCFYYRCEECEFILDTKCSTRWQVKKFDCDQHTFLPFLKQMQFTCEGCGEERKDIGWMCSKCQLLVHTKCAIFSRTVKVVGHGHYLALIYSLQEVKEQPDIVCEVCFEKVNKKFAAYYCQRCNYVVHLRCARGRLLEKDSDATNDSASNNISRLFSEGYQFGLIKDMNQAVNKRDQLERIQHFSHPHNLVLNHKEVPNNKVCDACMQLISIPFYNCVGCDYFLHCLCATISTNITPSFLPYTYTVLPQAPTPDGVFQCGTCNQYRHGFACISNTMWVVASRKKIFYDIQCLKIEQFQHKGYQHPFEYIRATTCKSCGEKAWLECSQGGFALCYRCITLPLIISHKDDEHSLELTQLKTILENIIA